MTLKNSLTGLPMGGAKGGADCSTRALGARVVSLSDSDGTVHAPDGFDDEQLEGAKRIKLEERSRISAFAEEFGLECREGATPRRIRCALAFPCATQNEIGEKDAGELIGNGCELVRDGSNMPCTEALELFSKTDVIHAPGKAANAG